MEVELETETVDKQLTTVDNAERSRKKTDGTKSAWTVVRPFRTAGWRPVVRGSAIGRRLVGDRSLKYFVLDLASCSTCCHGKLDTTRTLNEERTRSQVCVMPKNAGFKTQV